MERSEDQYLALVREVLITEPYRFKARSRTTESEKVRQQIADNLNSDNRLLTPIIPLSFPRRNLFFFFRETGVIAGSTNFSSNKRSLRYQSSKTSFSKRRHGIKTRTHYSILSRQASTPLNLLNLNLFFPRRWRRPRSRPSPFSLPPRPEYLKV